LRVDLHVSNKISISSRIRTVFEMAGLINIFKIFPKELFRVNNGLNIKVRPQEPGRRIYDIIAQNGQVEPKALDPQTYIRASLFILMK
jgi:hypothetical protein